MKRMTTQRRAILSALEESGRPMSPDEICVAGREEIPNLNLATVYRAVNALFDAGQLARVEVFGQAPRYELSGLAHHHHFLCESCDRVFDVPGCPDMPKKLAPRGFKVLSHEFTLFGLCKGCA